LILPFLSYFLHSFSSMLRFFFLLSLIPSIFIFFYPHFSFSLYFILSFFLSLLLSSLSPVLRFSFSFFVFIYPSFLSFLLPSFSSVLFRYYFPASCMSQTLSQRTKLTTGPGRWNYRAQLT
jgi:hypothetical protein